MKIIKQNKYKEVYREWDDLEPGHTYIDMFGNANSDIYLYTQSGIVVNIENGLVWEESHADSAQWKEVFCEVTVK